MTATPIPRTLSLTIYGDQDISVLSEYPVGRLPIHTKVLSETERNEAYNFIATEVQAGRQVYWISPLVEESETLDIASAVNMQEILQSVFPTFRVGLIHGKMKAREKDAIMQAFYERKIDILSSTSVVEVGVDNPNASVICIEAAERFGLSQLHQSEGVSDVEKTNRIAIFSLRNRILENDSELWSAPMTDSSSQKSILNFEVPEKFMEFVRAEFPSSRLQI